MSLEQRYRQWADELIDLSGRNDLISFQQTMGGTLIPSKEAVKRLLEGESLLISEFIDIEIAENRRAATGVIKKAIELEEQSGIECLRLISGFATWKGGSTANPNAPFLLYSLKIENPGVSLQRTRLKLISAEPEANPVFLLHLRRRLDIDIDEDAIEDAQTEGAKELERVVREQCPETVELAINPGFAIKNLRYQKLPMVKDLLSAVESLSANTLIAALAGDEDSKGELKKDIAKVDRSEPDRVPPENEFLVLDADSSQEWAINSALKGQNLVIEGPPGTGKSQTIANLIASYMAVGKSVLFVAEKRAAIDAVKKRVDNVGLGNFFLDLHSAETIRKRPAEPFVKALDEIANIPIVDYSENQQRLMRSRKLLVNRTKEIQEKRSPWGCSYLDILQYGMESSEIKSNPYLISNNEVINIKSSDTDDIKQSLEELESLSAGELLSDRFPLSKGIKAGEIKSSSDVQDVFNMLDNARPALSSIEAWVNTHNEQVRSILNSCEQVKEAINNIEEFRSNQTLDTSKAIKLKEEAIRHLKKVLNRNLLLRILSFLTDADYRQALKSLKNALINQVKPSIENLKNASQAYSSQQYLQSIGLNPSTASCPSELNGCIDSLLESISTLNRYINDLLGEQSNLGELKATLNGIERYRRSIPNAPRVKASLLKLKELGLSEIGLIDKAIKDFVSGEASEVVYKKIISAWAQKVEEVIRINAPSLASSTRDYLDRTIGTFRETDSEHIATTGQRIRRITAERAHKLRQQHPDQEDLLRQQSTRRRNRLSARKLFACAPEILKSVKPCWAMSPLVVSELLPANKDPFFDVVIFDEASQIVPFEAITSILRGKQTIVAGDSKQLSPTTTSFFSKSSDDDHRGDDLDDEDSFDAVDETESLLDAVKSVLPPVVGVRTLQWHYRSEDERLIAFSNKHPDLYGSRLVTAPSTSQEAPFDYHHIEGELREVTGSSPKAEVKKTVELVINHLKTNPHLSLAVIAFGSEHARKIENEFHKQVGATTSLPLFPEGKPEEKLVIRHLEAIQGDERDVVFIATGYGPKELGKVQNSFGPINIDKNFFGLRRLNVAVTRARKRVEVITTVNPYQYDDNRINSVGVKGLIKYLRFVKSGGMDLGDLSSETVPMNPFEQDIHDALVARGVGLVPQYGVSGYRLDFAVQHPEEKGRFVMAIEADGASYHSSDTARDRDRIRQNHLERLGWQFHRIWSTEWFTNKESEVEIAIDAVNKAIRSRPLTQSEQSRQKTQETVPIRTRNGPKPNLPGYPSIDDYGKEIAEYICWICSDGSLLSDQQIFEEVFAELPYSRRGTRIVERINQEISDLRASGKIP